VVLGYIHAFYQTPAQSLTARVAVEQPETSVTVTPNLLKSSDSFARVPDLAANVHLAGPWGNVQLAGVVRSLSVESTPFTYERDACGWGLNLSGALSPLQHPLFHLDLFTFGFLYGQGVGNYVLDLRALGGADAAIDAQANLKALTTTAYFVGYSHFWTPNLRSTVAYGQTDLRSIPTEGASAYRRGQYIAVNTVCQWPVNLAGDTATSGPHYAFAGLEYLYGRKETLASGGGEDHRVQLVVGLKF
jgi:hypothetical protein